MSGNSRTGSDGKINSILLIDNEHENIADLEMLLRNSTHDLFSGEEKVIYTASPDEAMREMMRAAAEGTGFSSIITDNHMDVDEENGTDTIDGQDFLRIILGRGGYCLSHAVEDLDIGSYSQFPTFEKMTDRLIGKSEKNRYGHHRNIIEFMKRSFEIPDVYEKFIQYYNGRAEVPLLMMFCGHPRHVDRTGLEDVEMVQKTDGCEGRVLRILTGEGILPEAQVHHSLEEHPRFTHKSGKPYNPRASHIRRYLKKGKRYS